MVRVKSVQLVEPTDIAASAVTAAKIISNAVEYDKVNDNFAQGGYDAIDSVTSWINFPTGFPGTPYVVGVGDDVTGVKVTQKTADSFEWVADAAGSAHWISIYK